MQVHNASCDLFWDSTFGDLVEVRYEELVGKLVEYVERNCDKDGVSDDDIYSCFCTFQSLMLQLIQKRGLDVRMNRNENETDFSSGTSEQGELCQVCGLLWTCVG